MWARRPGVIARCSLDGGPHVWLRDDATGPVRNAATLGRGLLCEVFESADLARPVSA